MELVLYDSMCRAIDACYEVDEVKDIRDKAKAMAKYLRQAKNREAERRCSEVRLRAEIKAGELLQDTKKAKASPGNQYTGKMDWSNSTTSPKTLADIGVSKDQSSRWQQMASAYKADPHAAERYLRTSERPTTEGFLRTVANVEITSTKRSLDLAAWVGMLKTLSEETANPWEIVDEMGEGARGRFFEKLHVVLAWLEKLR